jgi:hypothetical protein
MMMTLTGKWLVQGSVALAIVDIPMTTLTTMTTKRPLKVLSVGDCDGEADVDA